MTFCHRGGREFWNNKIYILSLGWNPKEVWFLRLMVHYKYQALHKFERGSGYGEIVYFLAGYHRNALNQSKDDLSKYLVVSAIYTTES